MPANKIVVNTENGAETILDLTNDTVTPETLAEGYTAHDKSGNAISGTMPITTLETWVFEMEDGTTVEKAVNVRV